MDIIDEVTAGSGLDAVAVRPPSSAEGDGSTRRHPLYFDRSFITSVHQYLFQPEHAEFTGKTSLSSAVCGGQWSERSPR